MRRWHTLDDVPPEWGRCAVTIGVFDGVHRGHQAIVARAVERARELGVPSVVLTFDPHPVGVLRPGGQPLLLTTQRRKAELLAGLGVDHLAVVEFTRAFAAIPAEDFVRDVLAARLQAVAVVVGENFRFGTGAKGDVELMRRVGAELGVTVDGVPLVGTDSTVCSSTGIRALIADGEVEAAAAALGRPHRVEGVVARGDRRGREIGFPTANLAVAPNLAVPADGVYASRLMRRRTRDEHVAAVSVGSNPTFGGQERRVEAFVLDFDDDLYGEEIAVDFVARLRDMERYDTTEALVAQMHDDVAQTRRVVSG